MKPKSVSNRTLTLLRKLKRKKYRKQEQLFLVEGDRAVEQVIENDILGIKELFFDRRQAYWEQPYWERALRTRSSSIIETEVYAEISDTDNPQGVLALCQMPAEENIEELAGGAGVILATDAIQDPGNLGTIIRTAAWFGISGLLSGKGTVDLFHPKVVRSTAGAAAAIPHANVELGKAFTSFEKKGWQIVLLDSGRDSISLRELKKRDKMIVVIGNEAHGIDKLLFTPERQKVRIASSCKEGNVESLNAAIATSITLYELT